MQFLRRYWTQIHVQLAELSALHRWLVGLGLIVMVLVLWIVLQYAGGTDYVPLMPLTADQQPEAAAQLKAEGIKTRTDGGRLLVPGDQRMRALAVLSQGGLLGSDTSAAFDQFLQSQSPWTSNQQNAQAYLQAKRKFLGQVIAKMKGVHSADVILDLPSNVGFGSTHKSPSASVMVEMRSGSTLNKQLVHAIAAWVSGAIAEMTPQDVRVIDANSGRPWIVPADDDLMPTETIELVRRLQKDYTENIYNTLSYIPGVIVAVNVRIDPTRNQHTSTTKYEASESLASERSETEEDRDSVEAGEPGVRSNTGAQIVTDAAGRTARTHTRETTETQYGSKPIVETSSFERVGHMPEQVNVTVNIPRSYFVQLYRQTQGDAEGEPDAAALQPIVDAQLAQIESQVKPLISTEAEGLVRAYMIPDRTMFAGLGPAAPTGVAAWMGSSWTKPAGLALLAMVSLGIMFGMVRKATQRPPMPSIEELAGIPPSLPTDDDLVGEAEASEATMDGVEVDDEEIQQRKMAEQISGMIRANPADAASLFGRWVNTED